jgi:hypothetical protein
MVDGDDDVIPFPFSKVQSGGKKPARDLGLTPLSRQIGSSGRSAKGHWCSRCRGIWYSYFLEAECPACGNRHG